LKPDGWRLECSLKIRLLDRLSVNGSPLGEYVDGQLYRGILTGFNEAFVIDKHTYDRLIVENARSKDILKPFLRGRDVKRWQVNVSDKYLIKIESSENKRHAWTGRPNKEAERIFSATYPAIHDMFNKSRKQLIDRYDQGKYFWELRSCEYWQEFEQPKIVFPDIAPSAQFAWDADNNYLVNTSYIMIAPKWLLAILNSSLILWFYKSVSNAIRGGYLRYIRQYVEQIPIPATTREQQKELERRVDRILAIKRNKEADISAQERENDEIIYKIYGLTKDEIKLVEEER
jgi:hypothetical protein